MVTSVVKEMLQGCLLWSSRNVLWTTQIHPTFYLLEGEWIVTEFIFMAELVYFKVTYCQDLSTFTDAHGLNDEQ